VVFGHPEAGKNSILKKYFDEFMLSVRDDKSSN
jgi:hypothetical protein